MVIQINTDPITRTFGLAPKAVIARHVGVSRHTVTEWLEGEPQYIKLDTLEKFARACDVQPGEFFAVSDMETAELQARELMEQRIE